MGHTSGRDRAGESPGLRGPEGRGKEEKGWTRPQPFLPFCKPNRQEEKEFAASDLERVCIYPTTKFKLDLSRKLGWGSGVCADVQTSPSLGTRESWWAASSHLR